MENFLKEPSIPRSLISITLFSLDHYFCSHVLQEDDSILICDQNTHLAMSQNVDKGHFIAKFVAEYEYLFPLSSWSIQSRVDSISWNGLHSIQILVD